MPIDLAGFDFPPPDLVPGPDLGRTPFVPALVHVGRTGVTCCVVGDPSGKVLYLTFLDAMNQNGQLRLADANSDVILGSSGVPPFGYEFTPDGSTILFLGPSGDPTRFTLQLAPVAAPKQVTTVIDHGLPGAPLASTGFFSPSGRYFLAGVQPKTLAVSQDLWVVDVTAAKPIYQRGNGAFDYFETVAKDDTLLFQDTIGGTGPTDPPVQTLLRISLPAAAAGGQPAAIDTHTSSIQLTPDSKTLVYNKTNGGLFSYDLAADARTQIEPSGVAFTVGPLPGGPIAAIAADGSLRAVAGLQEVYASPAGSADLFSPLSFAPDGQHVFFFKNVDTQNNHGDLYHAALPPAAAPPQLVASGVALSLIAVASGRVVFLTHLDMVGDRGDLVAANFDGSGAVTLGTGALSQDLRLAHAPRSYLAELTATTTDPNKMHSPIDGSNPILGALSSGASTLGAQASLNATAHAGAFAFDADGAALLFAAGVQWDANAINYVGSLVLYDTDAARSVPVALGGVSEIGAPIHRSLFVNAPTANPAGVYYLKY